MKTEKLEKTKNLINKLTDTHSLLKDEWVYLLQNADVCRDFAFKKACSMRDNIYGKTVFIRGLIEFTNYCRNDCYYCGIRRSNKNAARYRLNKDDILSCCAEGYRLGFRTFVLQGGEDMYFSDDEMCRMISSIKQAYPDCAVTLSVGERDRSTYQRFYNAGADRYLLRHETATDNHYRKLHPDELTLSNRVKCLYDLKEIGFQVGCGMMVGSPYQTNEHLAEDMLFLEKFQPHMVGIGPFISHKDTPFKNEPNGSAKKPIFMVALTRLLLPNVLLPATTALGTLDEMGREKAVLAGANVVMPNLSPKNVREKYMLYDNKISTGDEAAESLASLALRMEKIGYEIVSARGDFAGFKRK